ncbi:MAG: ABC transporter substrate-binding protein [Candidatus Binatia bacterium]
MKPKFWGFMVAAVFALLANDAAAQSGPKEKRVALNMVYNNLSVGAGPIWIAQRAGIFQKHGVDVTLSLARGSLSVQAMLAGSFPVGIVSTAGVVSSHASGGRLKIVAGIINTLLYSVIAAPDIKTGAQLKGKRVGVSRFGDSSELATRMAARQLGLDPDRDLSMVQVGSGPDRYAALRAGAIHAAVVGPAEVIRGLREGFNLLVDLTTQNVEYQGSVMAMTEDFMRQEEAALSIVRAVTEGLHFFKTRREESVRIMSQFLKGADVEALREGWIAYAERIFPAKPYPTVKGTELVIREVASQNPAAAKVTPERLFELRFVEKVDRSGFIDQLYR